VPGDIEGLIKKQDLVSDRIESYDDALKKYQADMQVKAVIIDLNPDRQKLGLSIRDLVQKGTAGGYLSLYSGRRRRRGYTLATFSRQRTKRTTKPQLGPHSGRVMVSAIDSEKFRTLIDINARLNSSYTDFRSLLKTICRISGEALLARKRQASRLFDAPTNALRFEIASSPAARSSRGNLSFPLIGRDRGLGVFRTAAPSSSK
jgi:predicted RNA-binding protein with RPS1 domain